MEKTIYRFEFNKDAALDQIEETIGLSIVAAGCLLGESAVRLDFGYSVGPSKATGNPTAVLLCYGQAGECVIRIFVGFASKEFGGDSFRCLRITTKEEANDTEHKYPPEAI